MKLTVETHDRMQSPQRLQASRVVIYDPLGNPIVAVLQAPGDPRMVYTTTCEDPEFNEVLAGMGISKTVIVTDHRVVPLDQIRMDG